MASPSAPPGWRVESSLTALVGGVDARGLADDPAAPTLKLEGLAVLGGIAVGAKVEELEAEAEEVVEAAEAAATSES